MAGLGATDYGGPYRDVWSTAYDELQSNSINLFIKTPNNKNEVGSRRDRYIPNPTANLEINYDMYEFLGKLMGYAICSGTLINMNIHPIVWKLLLSTEITFEEYETIDKMFYNLIKNIENNTLEQEEFQQSIDLCFTVQLSDGKEVELENGGKYISVTYENRDRFVKNAIRARLDEFKNQIKFIKKGLYAVIPENILVIINWKELEISVCGKPSLNIDHLKANTIYGVNMIFNF